MRQTLGSRVLLAVSVGLSATLLLLSGCAPWPPKGIAPEPKTVEIGLLCRKQHSPDIYRPRIYRHIDTLLGDGSIIGFNNEHQRPDGWYYPLICTWEGVVTRNAWMQEKRARYVDVEAAKTAVHEGQNMPAVTDWYTFRVSEAQAKALAAEWVKLEKDVPHFRLFGRNCATVAAHALVRAGILRPSQGGIRWIDRPENLINMVYEQYPETTLRTGFFGYKDGKPFIEPLPPQSQSKSDSSTQK